jgi:hypothetical protein
MITKITFAIQCASILMTLIIAHEYHDAKAANAAKLASAIAEARQAERSAAMSRSAQKAILDDEIRALEPTIPATALQPFKAKAVMRK